MAVGEYTIDECDSCAFPDIRVREYDTSRPLAKPEEKRTNKFCDICSHTMISHHVTYPGQGYPSWLGAIAYCTHAIIKAIKESKNE